MKILGPLFLATLWAVNISFSQNEKDASLLYLGPSDVTIGSVNGIHPNLNNNAFANYFNGDLSQKFRVKNIPLHFVGHISNEELRIGKPSYFRLNYDASTAARLSKIDLSTEQKKNK